MSRRSDTFVVLTLRAEPLGADELGREPIYRLNMQPLSQSHADARMQSASFPLSP